LCTRNEVDVSLESRSLRCFDVCVKSWNCKYGASSDVRLSLGDRLTTVMLILVLVLVSQVLDKSYSLI